MDNYIEYIRRGLVFAPEKKFYRAQSAVPIFIAFLCLVYGVVLKGAYLYAALGLIIFGVITIIVVFSLSAHEFTVKNRLTMQVAFCINWMVQFSGMATIVFVMKLGFNVCVFLIYLPAIIIPLLSGLNTSKKLKRKDHFEKRKITPGTVGLGGTIAWIIGSNIAALFRNVSQSTVAIVIVVCAIIINCAFSLGLLSIQRLYYISKYNLEEELQQINI